MNKQMEVGLVTLAILALGAGAWVVAATPDAGTLDPSTKEITFTAGPYPVANSSGLAGDYTCDETNPCDNFALTVTLPADYLATHPQDRIRIVLTPDAPSDDVELLLFDANGALLDDSRNGPGAEEEIVFRPVAGTTHYTVGTTAGTPSTGATATIALYTDPNAPIDIPVSGDPDVPASDGTPGVEFSASVPVDLQRSENEPLILTDLDGTIYVCGIASVSRQSEFIVQSTDGGDQFHLLGEPPRGQANVGGGGDCGMATSPVRNGNGVYSYAETGLGPLTNFGTSVSADLGKTISATAYSSQVPAVDRQWLTFSDATTVFMNYNNVETGNLENGEAGSAVVVQKSTDGGQTYGLRAVITPNGGRVGPIRSMPAELNPAHNGKPVVYYAVTKANAVVLAASLDGGDTWNNCTAATADNEPAAYFPVADNDREGNLYIGYSVLGSFNTFAVSAPNAALLGCNGGTTDEAAFTANPGFSAPVIMNRDGIETSLYPWLTAGGEPGRIAMSFYGSPTKKDVNDATARHVWTVYVSYSLDMLAASPHVQQVAATTHPMHYGSICLSGLACDTTSPGDRSLGDFFAVATNQKNGEIVLTYMNSSKQPGDTSGLHDTAYVVRQVAGPSLLGGEVAVADHGALREASTDPSGDALRDYSSFGPPAAARENVPAADLTGMAIGPALDLGTGAPLPAGGFTVTMTVADLSDTALQDAMSAIPAQSLLWIFRYTDGFRYSAASARWNATDGFTFGHNGYVGSGTECTSQMTADAGGGCLYYPGTTALQGKVDQATGTIQITVPLAMITALDGQGGPDTFPKEIAARPGDRVYDAAAFTQANVTSPVQTVQNYLIPLDNTPALDFLIPGGTPAGPGPTTAPPSKPYSLFGGAWSGWLLVVPALWRRRRR